MKTHKEFYTADCGGAQVWRVVSNTARTWKVVREVAYGRPWSRTVRAAEIGQKFHVTPLAALAALARQERDEIRILKDRLQRKRTALGMVEAEMRKLPGGVDLLRMDEAEASDARLTDLESGKAVGSATKGCL